MNSTAVLIIVLFLVAHVVSTLLIMRWAVQQVERGIGRGLSQLVSMFPPHLRAMLGVDITDTPDHPERINA